MTPAEFRDGIAQRVADHLALADWISAHDFPVPEPSLFTRIVYEVWADSLDEFERLTDLLGHDDGDVDYDETTEAGVAIRTFGSVTLEVAVLKPRPPS